MEDMVLFMWPLINIFWTFGNGFLGITSGARPADHILKYIQALGGLEFKIECVITSKRVRR